MMGRADNLEDGLKFSDHATLGLLSALEVEESVTQRGLAARIGIALGLTNSLIKRAISKGLVKVSQAPAKRYKYYVTPKGFSEKSRLVADYLSSSLSFFRQAKDEYGALFWHIKSSGIDAVILYGSGELAEIAVLAAHELNVNIQFILQPGCNQDMMFGYPVRTSMDDITFEATDAVILTSMDRPQESYDRLREILPETAVHAPKLLYISRVAQLENS